MTRMRKERIAILLFNLGGPDRQEAVEPFLFNLFNDKAIIALPRWPRFLLAKFIARKRGPKARAIYAQMGGGSPILPNTRAQAEALGKALSDLDVRILPAMRYWHPLIEDVAAELKNWSPDRILLLPLYPQFSTTTTGSAYEAFRNVAAKLGLDCPVSLICCYPTEPGFLSALADLITQAFEKARKALPGKRPKLVFSAHGLPEKIVAKGDPYVAQVRAGAEALAGRLGLAPEDWVLAFQSRVGPLAWVGPATDDVIRDFSGKGEAIIVAPIAFVSEHSETLVELDIEYRHLAESLGAPLYIRVPTVSSHPDFIAGLARLLRDRLENFTDIGPTGIGPGAGTSPCRNLRACPLSPGGRESVRS